MNCKKIYKYISIIFIFITFILSTQNIVKADDRIDKEEFKSIFTSKSSSSSIVPIELEVVGTRKDGSTYQWNMQTNRQAKTVWKIRKKNDSNYSYLFYCVEADKGFANDTNTARVSKIYNTQLDMIKDRNAINVYRDLAIVSRSGVYNKLLWILDNSYIPGMTNKESFLKKAGISIDKDKSDLTENDIEVVQQMVIWYFTNGVTSEYPNNLPSLYINGDQLSGIDVETTQYGQQIWYGNERQEKAEKLYKYFINNADENYKGEVEPNLTLVNNKAKVIKDGNYYIAGPYTLNSNNDSSKNYNLEYSLTNNIDFTLINQKGTQISKVSEGEDFYIKVNTSAVNKGVRVEFKIVYSYATIEKSLLLKTDTNYQDEQPVVLVKPTTIAKEFTTNFSIPDTTNVKVEKIWDDSGNQDGKRTAEVTIQLLRDGKNVEDPIKLNGSNGWKYEFKELPKLNSNGTNINYSIVEKNVPDGYSVEYGQKADGTLTITNRYNPEITSVTVVKAWEDYDNMDGIRPKSVTVQLKKGNTVIDEKDLNEDNEWTYTWLNLDKKQNGDDIVYTVEETKIGAVRVVNNSTNTYTVTKSVQGNTTTITNTIRNKQIIVKKEWIDNENSLEVRPSVIKARVYGKTNNSVVIQRDIWLYKKNDWKYTIENLPEYVDNQKVIYNVVELSTIESGRKELEVGSLYNEYYKVESYSSNEENDVLTIKNKIDTTSVSVTKVWNDNDNQDGKRPDTIRVNLYADNVSYIGYTIELPYKGLFNYTWTGLPKYKDGEKIEYKVRELNTDGRPISEGALYNYTYTVNYTGDMDRGFIITNNYTPETINVSGIKTWEDQDNKYNTRPDSITVKLLANEEVKEIKNVTKKDNWKYEFTNLPKYKDEKEIKYSIEETGLPGYTTTYENYNITNVLETRTLSVNKQWEDSNDQDGIRPDSVTVKLKAIVDGNEVDLYNKIEPKQITLNSVNNWTYTWENLPIKDTNGKTITYSVQEDPVEKYSVSYSASNCNNVDKITITNTHKTDGISKTVIKKWEDNNKTGKREDINVQLKKNGENEGSVVTLSSSNGWKYTWNKLAKYEKGNEVKYTVVELRKDGTEVENGSLYNDYYKTTYSEDTFTITNTIQTINISGNKTWLDNNNQDGIRPKKITVKLLQNGKTFKSTDITADDNWAYTFTDLPKYENGKEIQYSIEEANVPTRYTATYDGYNIINRYEPENTSIKVLKKWLDNENQDGVRPTSIDVRLYANDEIYIEKQTIYARNDWQYTFENIPVNKDGTKINYKVVELDENGNEILNNEAYNEAYKTTYDENTFTITNTHIPETVAKTVTKVWNDDNNQDGKRSESINVQLYANKEVSGESIILNESNSWSYTFENLPVYKDGIKITYTIKEVEVPADYSVSYSSENYDEADNITITNTYIPEKINIEGTKTWENDNESIRPKEITVGLYANDTLVDEISIDASKQWKYKFENLDKCSEGKEIIYTIKEKIDSEYLNEGDEEAGYKVSYEQYNIKNIYLPGETTVIVNKVWEDNNNQDGLRPESIQIQLNKNGIAYGDKITLNEDCKWSYTWNSLPEKENGEIIEYTVEEIEVSDKYKENYTNEGNIFTITNTYNPEETSKTVTKIWEDNNNQDGLRPESIQIQLKKNGIDYGDKITLSKDNNWTYTWNNLSLKENGIEIKYTVEESVKIEGYSTSYSEDTFTITNTHVPEIVSKTVKKIWDDEDNKDGLRPEEITIQLYANGNPVEGKTRTITSKEDWKCEFDNLPKYVNGKEIKYTVREVNTVPGYSITYENEKDNEFVITNKHIPGTISINGTKTWNDNNNQDGKRPENITINLYANGTKVKDLNVTSDEQGNWKYEFVNLPKFEDGKEIVYTVSEEPVEGYTTQINGYNITNTYTPETIEKTVSKIWADEENKGNIRPTTIEVQLKNGDQNVGDVVILSAGEDGIWQEEELKYTWNNLPKYEDGQEITYTVVELNIPDKYVVTYSDNTFTITNTYNPPEKTSITVNKIWEDNENVEGKRPEKITVNLLANGEKINSRAITQSDNWSYIFDNLEKYDENNNEIIYTVTEEIVSEYETTISEFDENTRTYTITNKYIVKEPDPKVDLALRKFITEINGENIEISRTPIVNVSPLKNNELTTAIYNHRKDPIAVTKGDIVTYTIRVYNEGEVNAYASKITDHLPNNLIPIIKGVKGINEEKYSEEIKFNENYLWYIEDSKTVCTNITAKDSSYSILVNENRQSTMLEAFMGKEGTRDTLDYIDVQIKCLVTKEAESGDVLTNIAQISEMTDEAGNTVSTDIDSTVNNVRNIYYDEENLPTYAGKDENKADLSDANYYYKGQEDDDDFEKLVIKVFDLALKKYISKVNDLEYDRSPKPSIVNKVVTYTKDENPVEVETNDIVTYTIRVYNEGDISGYAKEITDNIPEGLEFLPENSLNKEYKWIMLNKDGEITEDTKQAVKISTNYLSKEEEKQEEENLIKYLDGTIFNYKDVKVSFKVIQKATAEKIIINTAEIAKDANEKNEPVKDIDSVPNNNIENEDDIDTEKIKLVYFDLALRKFITKVNDMPVNNRVPEISLNDEGKITYTHIKDPLEVETNDIVVYTIRVYNEGKLAGYADEITDNIPQGLEFMPENIVNTKYNWKMIDENGIETTDISKAKKITTNYLSKINESEERVNLINKLENLENISYKDVEVAFKVVEPNTSDRIIINTAEISSDKDYRGNEVYDFDSIPGNDKETEDDIDKEYVKVKFFDLKLAKWVSEYSITYNGKTQTKQTGYSDEKEEIVKIDLEGKKLTKTSIEYKYIIKVTNEGEIAGYADEIKDYIPEGLSFNKNKNPDWKELENGSVVTTKLSGTLLKPGESATVEIVLDWVKNANNTGIITNLAEISLDRNDADTPDIDSKPNNEEIEEDDIDDAKVAISVKTGEIRIYFLITTVVIAIIGTGVYGIKKYVI